MSESLLLGTPGRDVPIQQGLRRVVLGTIHSMAADDSSLQTQEHNGTLLQPTAGSVRCTLRLQIRLHYDLLGLHALSILPPEKICHCLFKELRKKK